jgi:AcrR family transcriptional regulator
LEEGDFVGNQLQTRLNIVEALDTVLQRNAVGRVKVTQICKMVGISRTTFYEYFDDIYSVVTWYWDHIMSNALYEIGVNCDYFTGHLRSFEALADNHAFFYEAFKSRDYSGVLEYGSRHVKEIIEQTAQRRLGRPFTKAELLQLDFRNYGAANMTCKWVTEGMQATPKEMARAIEACTPEFFIEALRV